MLYINVFLKVLNTTILHFKTFYNVKFQTYTRVENSIKNSHVPPTQLCERFFLYFPLILLKLLCAFPNLCHLPPSPEITVTLNVIIPMQVLIICMHP